MQESFIIPRAETPCIFVTWIKQNAHYTPGMPLTLNWFSEASCIEMVSEQLCIWMVFWTFVLIVFWRTMHLIGFSNANSGTIIALRKKDHCIWMSLLNLCKCLSRDAWLFTSLNNIFNNRCIQLVFRMPDQTLQLFTKWKGPLHLIGFSCNPHKFFRRRMAFENQS